MISRTREQTTAAEPPPVPDTGDLMAPADAIDAGLDTLYRRHTPDLAPGTPARSCAPPPARTASSPGTGPPGKS